MILFLYDEFDAIFKEDSNIKIYGLDLPFDYYKKFIKLRADKEFLNNLVNDL